MTREELVRQVAERSRLVEVPQARFIWPLLAVAGAYALYKGSKRPKYKGFVPSKANLKYYEARQRQDVESLYGEKPYEQPGLGFTPQEMEARLGARSDEFAAARAGEEQTIANRFRAAGSAGTLSGAYYRAMQRARTSDIGRRTETRRENILTGAGQKREDLRYRLGATGSVLGQGTSLLDRYASAEMERARAKADFYNKIGSAALMGAAGGVGGGAAAAGGAGGGYGSTGYPVMVSSSGGYTAWT